MNAKRHAASLLLGVLLAACAGTPTTPTPTGSSPASQVGAADRDGSVASNFAYLAATLCLPGFDARRNARPQPGPDARTRACRWGSTPWSAGDTLWEIAQQYGVTVEALLAANPQITDRRLITPRDRIAVPPPGWLPGVPNVPLSGTGTAVIDGVMGTGEWDRAGRLDFAMKVPAHDGGGSVPASLYVMNDARNLYVAVKAPGFYSAFNPALEFDNDNDGIWPEEGDDVFLASSSDRVPPGLLSFTDDFRVHCPDDQARGPICGFKDTYAGEGYPAPGTTDGAAAGFSSSASNSSFVEMSHPLDSSDDAHDFSLHAGSVVGFFLDLRVISTATGPNCGYPECFGDTTVPANALAGHAVHPTVAAADLGG